MVLGVACSLRQNLRLLRQSLEWLGHRLEVGCEAGGPSPGASLTKVHAWPLSGLGDVLSFDQNLSVHEELYGVLVWLARPPSALKVGSYEPRMPYELILRDEEMTTPVKCPIVIVYQPPSKREQGCTGVVWLVVTQRSCRQHGG